MSLSRMRDDDHPPKVEINIVPLVDVALVLLIIFMVTATFVKTSGLRMELPEAGSTQQAPATPREVTIAVGADGAFAYEGELVSDTRLRQILLEEARTHGKETRVVIRGDRHAAHGRVVQAMSVAQEAGLARLIIATQLPTGEAHARP